MEPESGGTVSGAAGLSDLWQGVISLIGLATGTSVHSALEVRGRAPWAPRAAIWRQKVKAPCPALLD